MIDTSDQKDNALRLAAGRDVLIGIAAAACAAGLLFWLIPAQVSREATGNDVAPAFIPQLSAWVVLGLALLLICHRLLAQRPVWGSGLSRVFAVEIVMLAAAAAIIWLALSWLGFGRSVWPAACCRGSDPTGGCCRWR